MENWCLNKAACFRPQIAGCIKTNYMFIPQVISGTPWISCFSAIYH